MILQFFLFTGHSARRAECGIFPPEGTTAPRKTETGTSNHLLFPGRIHRQRRGRSRRFFDLTLKHTSYGDINIFSIPNSLLDCISVLFSDIESHIILYCVFDVLGLVQAHIAIGKTNDALATAKEGIALAPRSPTAMFMLATALSTTKEGQKEVLHST